MTEIPEPFKQYTICHSPLVLRISDITVRRSFSLNQDPALSGDSGTLIYGLAVPERDSVHMMGHPEALSALPIYISETSRLKERWELKQSVKRLSSVATCDDYRQRLIDHEAEEFGRKPPDVTIFDSRPEPASTNFSDRLAWEARFPRTLLDTLAIDVLDHGVEQFSLHVQFLFGFVRLRATCQDGEHPITREDVNLARALADRPDDIFGDSKHWGLCGVEGDSQHGYAAKVVWHPAPRRAAAPTTTPQQQTQDPLPASEPRRGWFAGKKR